jgi:hypothetical protein
MNRNHLPGIVLAVLLLMLALTGAQAACDMDHSVFRDAANRGFALEFSPAQGGDATLVALAQISHKTRGSIFKFEVGHTNGYGNFFLTRTDFAKGQSYNIYFFDGQLRETPVNTAAWAFVSGLGATDWYDTREAPQLGDAMWKFDRCMKK